MAGKDAGLPAVKSGNSPSSEIHLTPRGAWGVTALLMTFMVINYGDRAVLALAARPVMSELGLSAQQYGLISSSFFFLFSLSAVAMAYLATRVALKWLLLILAALWALTQVPVFFAAGVTTLFANRIILGAAEGPAGPLANSMAHSWFPPERRGLPSALISSGASLAKIFLAPILTLLILGLGWRYAFLALAALGLVWTLGWMIKGRTGPYATSSSDSASGSAPGNRSTHAGGPATARETFRWAVCNRTFAGLLLATFPMYGLTTVVISWMPAYLESGLGFSPMQAGFLYGLPSIAALALMLGAGHGTDRLLRRGISPRVARGLVPTLAICLGGAMVALLPVAAAEHRWAAVVLLMAGYGFGTLGIPVSYAAIGTLAEPAQRSSVLSLFIAIQTFSGVIAPWLTGVFVDAGDTQADGYNTAFVVIGSTIVVAAAVGALLVDPTRDDVVARLRRRAGAS